LASKDRGFNGWSTARERHVNSIISNHSSNPSVNAGSEFSARAFFHGPQFMPTVVRQEGGIGHDDWSMGYLFKAPLPTTF
jgi:hypothetical protein